MSTYMIKPADVKRKWYILDAADKPLGRIAAAAASILRGKHTPMFTPNVDCGDCVIIINSDKAKLTGRKMEQKYWYRFTGYIGNMKSVQYRELMQNRSDKAMELAVWGMLPHNTIGRKALTRLRIFRGEQHNHEAQKPEAWALPIK